MKTGLEEAKKRLIPEIMIKCMAREIRDGDFVFHGLASPLPILAMVLAKRTHAPNMVFLGVTEQVDPVIKRLKVSSADPEMSGGCVAYIETVEAFDLAQKGKLNVMFLGGAQIDKYGNTNLSVIGDYYRPKVRLPGGAATAFIMPLAQKTVLWTTRHSKRVLVEKVDFRTGQGYLEGGDSRERLGLRKAVLRLVTNLGVFGFDEETRVMRLESIHPGYSLDDILNNTGFSDLIIPPEVRETEPPTEEELKIIREVDPDGIRYSEFR